jgi:hypothetical protein
MYDAEQLILDSEIAMAVLGAAGDFVLIGLGPDDEIEAAMATAVKRGFSYCGVLVVTKDGQAAAKCEPDMDSISTCLKAALAFAHVVADRLKQPPKGDGVEWLKKLHELRDPRP